MMKAKSLYIITLFTLLLLGSCTRNHGDIGIWFGTWHVDHITAGDTTVNVEGNYFFQFQSKIFRVSHVGPHQQVVESYGTWEESEDGSKMNISFPDPNVYYIIMPGLEEENHFTVTRASSSDITFTKADSTGLIYSYHLKKQP